MLLERKVVGYRKYWQIGEAQARRLIHLKFVTFGSYKLCMCRREEDTTV